MHPGPLIWNRTREIRRGKKGGGDGRRSWPALQQEAAAAIAAASKVAGVSRSGATVHHFTNRLPREREEGKGNSIPALAWPGNAWEARAMAGRGELLRRARPGR